MYDVLELCAKPWRRDEPVICVDERSEQLLGDSRVCMSRVSGTPLRRVVFQYMPKHGSWLKMAGIEMAGLSRQRGTVASEISRCSSAKWPPGDGAATPNHRVVVRPTRDRDSVGWTLCFVINELLYKARLGTAPARGAFGLPGVEPDIGDRLPNFGLALLDQILLEGARDQG